MMQTASVDTKKATARGNSPPPPAPDGLLAPPVPALGNQAALRLMRKCDCGGAPDCDCDMGDNRKKKETASPRNALHRKSSGSGAVPYSPPGEPSAVLDAETQSFFEARLQRKASRPAPPVSPRLQIGAVDDPLEYEADAVADRVMRMPDPSGGSVSSAPARLSRKCASCAEEENKLRKKGDGHAPALNEAPQIVHEVLATPGQPLDRATRDFFEPRFGRDLSEVRLHTDGHAARSARSVQAQAYAVGRHIAFGSGMYAPSTSIGRNLLAHELAHTVQQDSGIAKAKTIRRRRIPPASELATLLDATNPDLSANKDGVVRLLLSAWAEMSPVGRGYVQAQSVEYGFTFPVGTTPAAQLALATPDQVLRFAQVVLLADPSTQLGDPSAGNSPPRNAADEANITTLVAGADKVFTAVAGGARDADITQIFGAANVAAARTKFGLAQAAMHKMQTDKKILSDRSGFGKETGTGGLTAFGVQIMVAPNVIDTPGNPGSQITLVHESMHAGNNDVKDAGGYPSQGEYFKAQQEPAKLMNAAHYAVIATRVLDPKNSEAFPGQTFTPGPVTPPVAGGTARPVVTDAAGEASQRYKEAWITAVNVHSWLVSVFLKPDTWNPTFSAFLPFWSKVEKMTIHKRAGTAPAPITPPNPVTEVDIAQSEGVSRKLIQGYQVLNTLGPPDKAAIEKSATSSQKAEIAKGPEHEAPVLVSLVRSQKVGEITGPVDRDERVVDTMSTSYRTNTMAAARDPAGFAD